MKRIDRKYYTERSNGQHRDHEWKRRGYVFWRVLEDGTWDCTWMGHQFKAKNWLDVCRILWDIRDANTKNLGGK